MTYGGHGNIYTAKTTMLDENNSTENTPLIASCLHGGSLASKRRAEWTYMFQIQNEGYMLMFVFVHEGKISSDHFQNLQERIFSNRIRNEFPPHVISP